MAYPQLYEGPLGWTLGQIWGNLIDRFVLGIAEAIPSIVAGVFFLLVGLAVARLVRRGVRTVLRRSPVNEKFAALLVRVVYFFLVYVLLVAFLEIIGLGQIALALAGVIALLGLAFGMATSGALGDVVAGAFLLGDRDFRMGVRVEAAGVTGTVEDVDLRKVRIRGDDGILYVIPNKKVEGDTWKVLGSGTEG